MIPKRRHWWRRHTTQHYWLWKIGYSLGLTKEPW